MKLTFTTTLQQSKKFFFQTKHNGCLTVLRFNGIFIHDLGTKHPLNCTVSARKFLSLLQLHSKMNEEQWGRTLIIYPF